MVTEADTGSIDLITELKKKMRLKMKHPLIWPLVANVKLIW